MDVRPAEIKKVLATLAETPRRIASMTGGVEDSRIRRKPDEDSWSASDILAHLRACAEVWGKGIVAMISKDNPVLRHVSPRTWIRKTDYPEQDFSPSLKAFAAQREDLLKSLRALATKDWARPATFTGTTKGRDQTVFSYALRIAEHEERHLGQTERALSTAPT
jgi:hypothetical protein